MKIISWNVNGLRAVMKKGLIDFLNLNKPDIFCLQEIKISQEAIIKERLDITGYNQYYFPAKRPGYSGVAIFIKETKDKKIVIKNGIGIDEFDNEGRVQVLESDKFYLLNIYFPNSRSDLSRLQMKTDFNDKILKFVKKLEKKKTVILTGDFNVAHQEIDLARPKANLGQAGFTLEEREGFSKMLEAKLIDTFRSLNPKKIQYSWWSFRAGARKNNVGWRIDYFLVSAKLKKSIRKAYILDQVTGSDHAPIGLEIF